MEEEQKNAETEAAAGQGFLGKKSGDNVMTPGSLVGKMEAQAQDVGNKAMASATSLPEIITSLVSRMAMQALTQGIGNVSAQIKSSASTKSQNAKTSANKNSSGNPQARFNLKF